jgi:hypothetical protein
MKKLTLFAAALATLAATTQAQKGSGSGLLMEQAPSTGIPSVPTPLGDFRAVGPTIISQTQNLGSTTLVLDISDEQSWDSLDSANNTILVVPLGAGASMTGIGWDVNLTTVGGSWLSEARFYFDGSDHDFSGLFLAPGITDSFSGSGSYSSGGIVDLTDNGIPDIPILGDGNLYIQLYESFDDAAGVVDADWTAGSSLSIVYDGGGPVVPTVSEWGLIVLTALLLAGGAFLIVRRTRAATV